MAKDSQTKKAVLYRMVMPKHTCPYGLKSKDLLEREGFEVEDHYLETREQTDTFMREHDVKTTAQTFIGDGLIGGHDDLQVYFGKKDTEADDTTYQPIIALFSVAALLAVAFAWVALPPVFEWQTLGWFISISMVLPWLSIPGALFIGTVGAVSVFKAVYVDKRELKCACVGGDSNVPLGFASLTENLMMVGMAVVMAIVSFT